MIVRGKHYEIIYEGAGHEYQRRGEYGGSGYAWDGVVRIQTVRGRFVSIFALRAGVSIPGKFNSEFLFTHSLGSFHHSDFVGALPDKSDEMVDYIAELLIARAQRREPALPLARVNWSGLEWEKAVQLGFVVGREGQVAMGMKGA